MYILCKIYRYFAFLYRLKQSSRKHWDCFQVKKFCMELFWFLWGFYNESCFQRKFSLTNRHAQHILNNIECETFDRGMSVCISIYVYFFSFRKMGYHDQNLFLCIVTRNMHSCYWPAVLFVNLHYTYERKTIYFCCLNCPQL